MTVKNAPNQPYLNKNVLDWELEETLVDRRNSLFSRLRRLLFQRWILKGLLIFFVLALFNADLMATFLTLLGAIIQVALFGSFIIIQFVGIFWFLSRARMYEVMPGAEGISFADYRGQPELLEQAQQIVTLLRGVKAFEGSGGEPLNGLLLEGPPGTGKTWLAQAISTEAGVPFYYVDTSSLQGMFIGTGAMKVGRVYAKARKKAKEYGAAVIFLDEIESVGARGGVSQVGNQGNNPLGGFGGGGDMSGLLNTLLVEMSGFNQEHNWRAQLRAWFYRRILRREPPRKQKRVLTIGATNRMGALDPALLRPGRFDKKIRVDKPDMEGRRDIIAYYLSKMAHDDTMNPAILATETPGYTPADIKYLLNEALRYAIFDGRRYISYKDFRLAQPEHEMGLRAPLKHMSQESRRRLAYHEAGHAVAVRLFLPLHRIARIMIVRQGMAFGHVMHHPARESYQRMLTRDQMLDRLRVSAAGKAAEIEFCGLANQTLGVGGDFMTIRATLTMMASAGMLGPLGGTFATRADLLESGSPVTGEMARAMEETFQRILLETRTALRENGHIVEALVELLLKKEELLADEVRAFFDQYGLHTPDPTVIRDGEEISLLDEARKEELAGD
ncbi:MAG: AAA family ATPase [Anaerolineae bacterium]|nr:AAA family ATPase [Anaerolineae bacterium]